MGEGDIGSKEIVAEINASIPFPVSKLSNAGIIIVEGDKNEKKLKLECRIP